MCKLPTDKKKKKKKEITTIYDGSHENPFKAVLNCGVIEGTAGRVDYISSSTPAKQKLSCPAVN